MKFIILFRFFFVFVIVNSAFSAGGRAHVEMGKRAIDHHFDQVDQMLPGLGDFFSDDVTINAYYSGIVFPDWGYDGINPNAGEYSHWTPFQKIHFDFLIKNYPPPWDDEAKRQIAFFFGAISHGVTDIPWHFSRGDHVSFIDQAKKIDGAKHFDAEAASDIFTHSEFPKIDRHGKFWFPISNLLAIFDRSDFDVTRSELEKGRDHEDFYWKIGSVGRLISFRYKKKFPWVHAHYKNYYYGGIDHGASITATVIRSYYAHFHNGFYYQNLPYTRSGYPDEKLLSACEDLTISDRDPNYAEKLTLEIGDGKSIQIYFDISNIDPTAKIADAKLWLFLADRSENDKVIEAYFSDRSENGPVSQTTISATTPIDQWLSWEISDAVQFWIENPDKNFGLILKEKDQFDDDRSSVLQFYSSEAFRSREDGFGGGDRVSKRPALIIMLEKSDQK